MNLRRPCLFCAVIILASCSDRAQELEEKVTQMQRQLDQTEKQLQAANQALANRASATQTATPASTVASGLPTRETVEQSYATSAAAFRKELDATLKDFSIQSVTTHSVQMPSEFFPFTSQLSLDLLSKDGKNFTTDIPVKADATGKWVFPTIAEVTQRIENAGRMASAGDTRPPSTTQNQTSTAEQPRPYMKVNGTFVIQWPDSGPAPAPAASRAPVTAQATVAPAATAPPPPPPPPAQPSAPPRSGPNAVMPSDRDVHIQFPSPP